MWPDLAKGLCILLVVLHHATTKHYAGLVPAELAVVGDAWVGFSHLVKPIRMPLFFLISGLFASGALHRPWRRVVRRVAGPYYLYVVWLLLLGVAFSVERSLPMNRTQDLGELALDLVFASTGLWFLYALAVYFVLAKLLVRVRTTTVLAGAAAGSALALAVPPEEVNRMSVLVNFVFFLAGSRRPDLLRASAGFDRRRLLPALGVAYAVLAALLAATGAPRPWDLLLSAVGVPAAVLGSVALSRRPAVAGPLAWLGRRTLPVYVLHMPVLALVHHTVTTLDAETVPGLLMAVAGYPLLVTALVAAACLGLHAVLLRARMGFLFELPHRPRVEAAGGSASGRDVVHV
ncbi:acyltransferase family protein [Nocardioides koreensis]|uniref:acyltransferase family protein n=1 Tax=Nocardioides koreensis TaxID=433651 RepID=UPI0031D79999